MTDGFEAAADIATGGVLAREADGLSGAGHGHPTHPADCLNCGTRLVGEHCHVCGQAGHVHRTLGAFGHDILHGVFHFDGKAWRTLPMLALHPGELTRRYIDGERARFVSPVALFLFSVFLLFAVVSNLPGWSLGDGEFLRSGVVGGVADARERLVEERTRAIRAFADVRADIAEERAEEKPSAERIARLNERLATARKAAIGLDRAVKALPAITAVADEGTGNGWLDAKWKHAKENPKLLIYKVKTSAYKYSWALIPLSLPFLWLLFPFSRRFNMYDHAIFATYSLTFMSLFAVLLGLLSVAGVTAGWLVLAATLVPLVHVYKQLKGTYRLSRLGAGVRLMLLVVVIAGLIVPSFVAILVYLGLDG